MAGSSAPVRRRWIKRLAWALAGLAALLLVLWWGVPALLLWQAPPRLSQALGRPVTIGAVSWTPWRLELRLDGLRVGAAPGATPGVTSGATPGAPPAAAAAASAKTAADATPPLLQIAHLRIDLSIASLRHGAPVVEALAIDGLRLHLARTAPGHYDIDDLLARLQATPTPPPGTAEPARFALYNLALTDARLRLDDRPAGRLHTLDALDALTLTLQFLSNLPADVAVRTAPRLAFTLNGTRIDSASQALPFASTRSGELTLAFADLDMQPWLAYLPTCRPACRCGWRRRASAPI